MPNPAVMFLMPRQVRKFLLIGVALILAVVVGFGALLGAVIVSAVGAGSSAANVGFATWTGCDASGIVAGDVAGLDVDQVENAALILNAATAAGLGTEGQILGLQAALVESGLRSLERNLLEDRPGAVGLFQLDANWGPLKDRQDPRWSAAEFFNAVEKVPNWKTSPPDVVIGKVLGTDPDAYTLSRSEAVTIYNDLVALCLIPGDPVLAAQLILRLEAAGNIRFLLQPHKQQIVDIAGGSWLPACNVDVRVLQLIVLAAREFDSVGISYLNRKCTGESGVGVGVYSRHYRDTALAVDFSSLNGQVATGSDDNSIRLAALLISVLPKGSELGQVNCRAAVGKPLEAPGIVQVVDSCDHVHVALDVFDRPLRLAGYDSTETDNPSAAEPTKGL